MQKIECNKCGRPIGESDFSTESENKKYCWECSLLVKNITIQEFCFAYDIDIEEELWQ